MSKCDNNYMFGYPGFNEFYNKCGGNNNSNDIILIFFLFIFLNSSNGNNCGCGCGCGCGSGFSNADYENFQKYINGGGCKK